MRPIERHDRVVLGTWGTAAGVSALLWWSVLLADLGARIRLSQIFDSVVLRSVAHLELELVSLAAAASTLVAALSGRSRGGTTLQVVRASAGRSITVSAGILALVGVARRIPGIASGVEPHATFVLGLVTAAGAVGLLLAVVTRLGGLRFDRLLLPMASGLWLVALAAGPGSAGFRLAIPASCLIGIALALAPVRHAVRWAAIASAVTAPALATWFLQPRFEAPPVTGQKHEGRTPNVVLLVVDTVRYDRSRGTERVMPALSEWAKQTARVTEFGTALAGATSTVPSVKALLTAESPSRWGFRSAGREPPPAEAWTLPHALHEAGYATAVFSANALLRGGGFDSGFEEGWIGGGLNVFQGATMLDRLLAGGDYWTVLRITARRQIHKVEGGALVRQVRRSLGRREERPRFIYIHLIEPHWPYYRHGFGVAPPGPGVPADAYVDLLRFRGSNLRAGALSDSPPIRALVGAYEEELRAADGLMRDLLTEVDRALGQETLVVVTSDHGEEFFEHGRFSHGHDVYEELAHVPLLIRWPDAPRFSDLPRRVNAPVSLVDLAPTILDLLGLEAPPRGTAGRSMVPLLEGSVEHPPTVTEAFDGSWCRLAYREGKYKVRMAFHQSLSPLNSPHIEAFDLETDPAERQSLGNASPDIAELMERARTAAYLRWRVWPDRDEASGRESTGTDEALEQLRALGYVQ